MKLTMIQRIYYILLLGCALQTTVYGMEDKDFWASQGASWTKPVSAWLRGRLPSTNAPLLPVNVNQQRPPGKAGSTPGPDMLTVGAIGLGTAAWCLLPTYIGTPVAAMAGCLSARRAIKFGTEVATITAAKETNKNLILPTVALVKEEGRQARTEATKLLGEAKTLLNKTKVDIKKAKDELLEEITERGKEHATTLKHEFKQESTSLITKVVIGAALAITTYFVSRIIWNRLERHYNKPKLDFKITPLEATLRSGQRPDLFTRLVLAPAVEEQLMGIVEKTALAKRRIQEGDQVCTYRGLLLCGPKGSGKQLFAENLARYVGMDFIELSVASLTEYKEESDMKKAYEDFFKGVASKSSNGAIVFINNAGILLSNRKATDNTPLSRQIACFIEHVENASDKFMVILSAQTDEEPSLTAAMSSIIQTPVIVFDRPDFEQRVRLLEMHRNALFCGSDVSNECASSALLIISDEKIQDIAGKLDGASAKEIFEIVRDIKMDALASPNDQVTLKSVDKIVQDMINTIAKRPRK